MLDSTLKKYLKNLAGDADVKYMEGVTSATLFRFLNGSVYFDNIRKPVVNSVLYEFEDFERRELLLPFFADMRYRGRGLKKKAIRAHAVKKSSSRLFLNGCVQEESAWELSKNILSNAS